MPKPSALPEAPPEAVARFRATLSALPIDRLGLAVSGGPDSLALLVLAHAARPGTLAVATVDHGLRPAAAAEARAVAALCERLAIPHDILVPDTPLAAGGNLHERARVVRYGLLGAWARGAGIGHVATAHHRDDVAESFLLRALRGSGVGGLARMAAAGPMPYAGDLTLLRPLLDWSRDELAAIVARAGLAAAHDPSNDDPRFDRARIRALLARAPELDPAALARAAANLADAEAALDYASEQAWRSRARQDGDAWCVDLDGLPHEYRRRLCRRALRALAPGWDGEGLDGLMETLATAPSATLAGVQVAPGPEWRFRRVAAHRSPH